MAPERNVTFKEMAESQERLKEDLVRRIESGDKRIEKLDEKVDDVSVKLDNKINASSEKMEEKVNTVDEKVDHLNTLVLPLTEAMKQTAENTKEMSTSLKEFTTNQRETNGFFHQKLNEQDLAIQGVENITKGLTDKRKYNATIIVAVLSLIGVFITGLFQLAPLIFG